MNDIYNLADVGQQKGTVAKYMVPALTRDWLQEKPEEHVREAGGGWRLEVRRHTGDPDLLDFHLTNERSEEQSSYLGEPDDYRRMVLNASFRRAFRRLLTNQTYFYGGKSLQFKPNLLYSRPSHWRALNVADPPNLHELEAAFEKSLSMLDWEDNWDGEGSPHYERATWERARIFVLRSAREAWLTDNGPIEPPVVGPGPHGAIDLLWRNDTRKLIITIPPNEEDHATFYYENNSDESIEGTINLQYRSSKAHTLLMCMV
jgi:hypothetical protein